MLNCEIDTPAMEANVKTAFWPFITSNDVRRRHPKDAYQFDFEHGQWYVTEKPTGRSWSVNDDEGVFAFGIGFCFEQVSEGSE